MHCHNVNNRFLIQRKTWAYNDCTDLRVVMIKSPTTESFTISLSSRYRSK